MIMVVSPAVGGSGTPIFKLLKESASHLGGAIQNELEDTGGNWQQQLNSVEDILASLMVYSMI